MFNRKSSYALNKKDPNAIVYIDPSVPGQAICLEAYKESEMFYLSLINRLDQK